MTAERRQIVVTGGAGFIGAHVCRLLDQMGVPTVVLDDLSTGSIQNLRGLDVDLVEASILDAGALASACKGAHTIIHLAARPSVPRSLADPVASHEVNATGTVRVLEAARAAEAHVLVASSSSVYGRQAVLPKSETAAPQPASPYAASKLATEAYALSYARSFSLGVLAFRFFNVYGPLQAANHAYAAVIPRFIDAALAGRALEVHGDGLQTRDFTYVETVAGVLVEAALNRIAHDGPVNLAFGSRISLLGLIEKLEAIIGQSVAVEHTGARAGDVRDSQADDTILRGLFPQVEALPLEEGLRNTVQWFQSGSLPPTRGPATATVLSDQKVGARE